MPNPTETPEAILAEIKGQGCTCGALYTSVSDLARLEAALERERAKESDGEMLVRLGMDGAKWAHEFCKKNPALDEGTMLGWFANSIMAGWDHAKQSDSKERAERSAKIEYLAKILDGLSDPRADNRYILTECADLAKRLREIEKEEK